MKKMFRLNRIFLALCLLCVGQAFSMTREGINARKAVLADIEKSLCTTDLTTKRCGVARGKKIVAEFLVIAPNGCYRGNAFKGITFQGITVQGGTKESVIRSLRTINEKLESIEQALETEQRTKDKTEKEELVAIIHEMTAAQIIELKSLLRKK